MHVFVIKRNDRWDPNRRTSHLWTMFNHLNLYNKRAFLSVCQFFQFNSSRYCWLLQSSISRSGHHIVIFECYDYIFFYMCHDWLASSSFYHNIFTNLFSCHKLWKFKTKTRTSAMLFDQPGRRPFQNSELWLIGQIFESASLLFMEKFINWSLNIFFV